MFLSVLKGVGMLGEAAWIIGMIMTYFVPSDKPQRFFKKHKRVAVVFITLCIIGVVYFLTSLFLEVV